jgi:hypothetical protein
MKLATATIKNIIQVFENISFIIFRNSSWHQFDILFRNFYIQWITVESRKAVGWTPPHLIGIDVPN